MASVAIPVWSTFEPLFVKVSKGKGQFTQEKRTFHTRSGTLEWTDLLTHLLAQPGKDAREKISRCGLCPLYSHQRAQQDSCHQRSTFVPKGGSASSMQMLDCGVGGLWDMSRRRTQEGGKLACLDRQWHQSFKRAICSV